MNLDLDLDALSVLPAGDIAIFGDVVEGIVWRIACKNCPPFCLHLKPPMKEDLAECTSPFSTHSPISSFCDALLQYHIIIHPLLSA